MGKLELIIKERRLRWLGHVLRTGFQNTSSGNTVGNFPPNSRPGNCDKESKIRIGKTPNVFGRLVNIWKCKRISLPVKIDL